MIGIHAIANSRCFDIDCASERRDSQLRNSLSDKPPNLPAYKPVNPRIIDFPIGIGFPDSPPPYLSPPSLLEMSPNPSEPAPEFPISKSEAEWKFQLTPNTFYVLRRKGTEPPGTSPLVFEDRPGTFSCVGCGNPLYASDDKFFSFCGWPAFSTAIEGSVATEMDYSAGMERTEVHCAKCGGHLGHIFDDGPKLSGMRHCINGICLRFEPLEGGVEEKEVDGQEPSGEDKELKTAE